MKLTFQHVGIVVSDLDKSVKFYRDVLGFKVRDEPPISGGPGMPQEIITGLPGARSKIVNMSINEDLYIELAQYLEPEGKRKIETRRCDVGTAHVSFTVDDCLKAYEELKAKGVQFVNPPAVNRLGLRATYFLDPDGNTLAITDSPKLK